MPLAMVQEGWFMSCRLPLRVNAFDRDRGKNISFYFSVINLYLFKLNATFNQLSITVHGRVFGCELSEYGV
jgi:hypothetical protein